jgi:hypothetical protein
MVSRPEPPGRMTKECFEENRPPASDPFAPYPRVKRMDGDTSARDWHAA